MKVAAVATKKNNLPLSGRTILITRTQEGNASEAEKMECLGARVLQVASIEMGPPSSWEKLDEALAKIRDYDWIIFTSANGVKGFFKRYGTKKLEELKGKNFACVGPSTRKALEEMGFYCAFQPERFLTSELGLELSSTFKVEGSRILLARAEKASADIITILERAGAFVSDVPVYKTNTPKQPKKLSQDTLSKITDVTLTSPSTVEGFVQLVTPEKLPSLKAKVHCIGPVTAKKAKEIGLNVTTIAKTHSIDGMIDEILNHIKTGT
jgi:uroporphyrinogen III methyltransferase/synthase